MGHLKFKILLLYENERCFISNILTESVILG